MNALTIIMNSLIFLTDGELRRIRQIIMATARSSSPGNAVIAACNDIYIKRLTLNPHALKMSFWANHFEWQALKDYPEIKGTLLDFGCGSGHSDILLARSGMRVHGIDLSPVGIAIANYLKSREPDEVKKNISFSVSDVTQSTPDGEPFDSAWASHVFEHIVDPGPVLRGLRRWLKPNAYILISVPLGHAYDDPGHVNHFRDIYELKTFLNAHLTVNKVVIEEQHQVIRALCLFTS